MKNKKFSFVKWLTNRDVEKLVEELGYEIMPQEESKNKVISRYKDKETGENHIHVFCKDLISIEARKVAMDGLRKIGAFRDMMNRIGLFTAMLGVMSGDSDNSFSKLNDMIILDISDYFIFEHLSLKDDQAQIENNRRMIKIYQDYMTKKFGRFYNGMKSAEYKRFHKQIREEESKEAENQTEKTAEDNNSEM